MDGRRPGREEKKGEGAHPAHRCDKMIRSGGGRGWRGEMTLETPAVVVLCTSGVGNAAGGTCKLPLLHRISTLITSFGRTPMLLRAFVAHSDDVVSSCFTLLLQLLSAATVTAAVDMSEGCFQFKAAIVGEVRALRVLRARVRESRCQARIRSNLASAVAPVGSSHKARDRSKQAKLSGDRIREAYRGHGRCVQTWSSRE